MRTQIGDACMCQWNISDSFPFFPFVMCDKYVHFRRLPWYHQYLVSKLWPHKALVPQQPWNWLVHPGPRFNIKMTSYQYRKSHCGDKRILRPSYLHNGISYTGKTTSLYWIRAQDIWGPNIVSLNLVVKMSRNWTLTVLNYNAIMILSGENNIYIFYWPT